MDVKLPNLGEGADSGTVVSLFVKEGDRIEKDQPVIELENEKAVATIPSTAAGVISKIHVKNGDKISAGQRIVSVNRSQWRGAAPAASSQPPLSPKRKSAPAVMPPNARNPPTEELPHDEPAPEATEEAVTESNQSRRSSIRLQNGE